MKKYIFIILATALAFSCSKGPGTGPETDDDGFNGVVTSFTAEIGRTRAALDGNDEASGWSVGDRLNLLEVSGGSFTGVNQIFTYDASSGRFAVSQGEGLQGGKTYLACYSNAPLTLPSSQGEVLTITPSDAPEYGEEQSGNLLMVASEIKPREELSVTLTPLYTILWIGFDTSLYKGKAFTADRVSVNAPEAFLSKVAIGGDGSVVREGSETYGSLEFEGLDLNIDYKTDIAASGSGLRCKVIPNPHAADDLAYGFLMSGVAGYDKYSVEFSVQMDDQPLKAAKYELQIPIKGNPEVVEGSGRLTEFVFKAGANPSIGDDLRGVVDEENRTVTIELPSYWMDATTLVAEFKATDGATVKVGGVVQQSGVSSQDFSSPVVYTVEGLLSPPEEWTVSVNKPTRFRIPDTKFRTYLKGQNAAMFDEEDYLIIAKAVEWTPTQDVFGGSGFDIGAVGDFTGIEFFPKLETGCFADATAPVLDLSRNNQVRLVLWWNGSIKEIDLSNSSQSRIEINQTAGSSKLTRLICRDMQTNAEIFLNSNDNFRQDAFEYIDIRGSVSFITGKMGFADNARVLVDQHAWNSWNEDTKAQMSSGKNISVELYNDAGEPVETLKFNE